MEKYVFCPQASRVIPNSMDLTDASNGILIMHRDESFD